MATRWDAEELSLLTGYYHAGEKVASLAVRYGVSRIRIYQLLKQAGIVVRGPQKAKDGIVADVLSA